MGDNVNLQLTPGVELMATVWTGERCGMCSFSMRHHGTPVRKVQGTFRTALLTTALMLHRVMMTQLFQVQESCGTELALLWVVSSVGVQVHVQLSFLDELLLAMWTVVGFK